MGVSRAECRSMIGGMPPSIAVEGSSGVGKSVTAGAIAGMIPNAQVFGEYFDYFDPCAGDCLPRFPPRSVTEVTSENRIWPELDLRREAHRTEAGQVKPGIQIVDTSPISVVGYEMAKLRFGFPSALGELALEYVRLYECGALQEPTGWIFLSAPPRVVLQRIESRGGSREFLKRAETIEYIDSIRRYFATRYLAPEFFVWVDNSEIDLEHVALRASRFVFNLERHGPSHELCTFLQDLLCEYR